MGKMLAFAVGALLSYYATISQDRITSADFRQLVFEIKAENAKFREANDAFSKRFEIHEAALKVIGEKAGLKAGKKEAKKP